MANAWMIGDSDLFRYVIKRELKDHGVKIGKLKGNSRTYSGARNLHHQDKSVFSPVFGVALSTLPCCKDPQTGLEIPRFVKECVEFLRQHLDEEGLFRKSGSHARQKELQNQLSRGNPLPQDCQVADVASILKLFFRDLPEPIIHPRHQAWILKCVAMEDEILKEWTTLLLLCILPAKNLQLLRYIMIFLADVASKSENNRMDPKNLALVLVPSILGGDSGLGKTVQIERQIKLQTVVIEIMINNAKDIGVVPDYILDRMVKTKNRSNEALDNLTSEDELERSSDDNLENNLRIKRKKRRSGTFHGIVNGLGQMGQKVGGLLKSSSSLDNLDKTPENLNNVETPNLLRSSKRKASDDIGSIFSASKRRTPSPVRNSILRRSMRTRRKSSPMQRRRAILRQMTVDPHYGKKGVNLHKSNPSSPMTPLQSTKPALGEIDALDSQGKTLFHFNTPSIKFADDSFSGFSSTPSTSSAAEPPPTGMTPRRNKLKKLNPLNSRRFKRLSLGAIGGSSRAETPLKIPQRQNNQHPSKYIVPEANVGHRLANQPNPEGFGTMHLVPRHPECKEAFNRCPPSQSNKEVPSTMYTPPSYLMKMTDVTQRDRDREDSSSIIQKLGEPPLVEARHLENGGKEADHMFRGCIDAEGLDDHSLSSKYQRPRSQSCLSVRCASPLAMCLSNNLPEDDAMLLGEEYSPKPTRIRKNDASVTDRNVKSSQSHAISLEGRNKGDERNAEEVADKGSNNHHLPENVSQKSLSSVLSGVTVNSTKSYFSIEVEPVRMEKPLCLVDTDTRPETSEVTGISSDDCDMEGTVMEVDMHTETRSEPILSYKLCNISNSLGALHEIPSANKTAEWILKKTISVDSGKGESIEDLEQPTHKRNNGEAVKEEDSHVTLKPNQETVREDGEFAEPNPPREGSRQSTNTTKVNPSKLRPLKVDHNNSSMKQFRIMQKRMQIESGQREMKTVKQKIRMFNSLSEDEMSDSGRDGSVSFTRHHSGSDLPVCLYTKDADGSFLQTPRRSDLQTTSLSPLVKSVSYDSGLKELSKLSSTDEERSKPSVQLKVLRKMSSKSSEEDSFEAAMDSANKALSNFKRFAAETSTPTANRKPLGDKSNWVPNEWSSSPPNVLAPHQVNSRLQRSPAFLLKSPTYKKQLKRLNAEDSPNWQRRSPREKFECDNYMHLLRSPRGHHGSPRNPFVGNERKGRRRSRHVRKEWQV